MVDIYWLAMQPTIAHHALSKHPLVSIPVLLGATSF
jgi:hypothetical protein